jgi:hypothetical protein
MWFTVQIIFILLGIGLFLGGDKLAMPLLENAGIACFGLASMVIGWEGIITRRITIGRRRHGSRQTFTGVAAMLQGVQFNLLGVFLIVVAIMIQINANGRAVAEQMARHPGVPLIVFGMICLIQAVITLIGSKEMGQDACWVVILGLLISRLLPGIILVALGLGAVGLGFFEIVAPNTFDQMGGEFLEVLYGLK